MPKALLDHDVPVVLTTFGQIDDARVGVIDHDDESAMEAIVDHLHGLGHRRVAFVSLPTPEHSSERRRIGLAAALKRRDLQPVETTAEATAIVAHNDMQAIAAIDWLERNGKCVPENVSVVGYDDVPLASHSRIGSDDRSFRCGEARQAGRGARWWSQRAKGGTSRIAKSRRIR